MYSLAWTRIYIPNHLGKLGPSQKMLSPATSDPCCSALLHPPRAKELRPDKRRNPSSHLRIPGLRQSGCHRQMRRLEQKQSVTDYRQDYLTYDCLDYLSEAIRAFL